MTMSQDDVLPPVWLCHVAGPVEGQVQRCARCDAIIQDVRGAMVEIVEGQPATIPAWPEGEPIYTDGTIWLVAKPDGLIIDCARWPSRQVQA